MGLKMSNYDSKKKFDIITQNSHFLRVDETHPLELLVGLNDFQQKNLRFIGTFEKAKIKSTRIIEVTHTISNKKLMLNFTLIDNDFSDLFYLFCNDLIDSSRLVPQSSGYVFLVNRYEKWKGFGTSSHKYLSENEIKGLLGEIYFLKVKLFPKYGISQSIDCWTGTEPTKKDFSYGNIWYESKSVSSNVVTISSIEQLESDSNGYLVLHYLEKMSSESNGISLNNLIDSVLDLISADLDRSHFIMKTVQAGYYHEEYYDQFVYKITREEYYEVNSDFPKLCRSLLPSALSNARYDLVISMLSQFKRDNI
jgi:hypothetical protein